MMRAYYNTVLTATVAIRHSLGTSPQESPSGGPGGSVLSGGNHGGWHGPEQTGSDPHRGRRRNACDPPGDSLTIVRIRGGNPAQWALSAPSRKSPPSGSCDPRSSIA